MSLNASSTSDFTGYNCATVEVSNYIKIVIISLKILLLILLYTFVLLGHQRWRRRQRSLRALSHSDFFTYHLAVMEMFLIIGFFLFLGGLYSDHSVVAAAGLFAFSFVFNGELFFHILTCIDRYLAVVHPVTYLRLRNTHWIRIRDVVVGFVWLLSLMTTSIYRSVTYNRGSIQIFCFAAFSIVVTSFCTVSVLCVLIRPGPGEKERVDPSKQRAFLTITAISCVLWFWFVGILIVGSLDLSPNLDENVVCVVITCLKFVNIPCSLVSPLLYLHKMGKLSCCKRE